MAPAAEQAGRAVGGVPEQLHHPEATASKRRPRTEATAPSPEPKGQPKFSSIPASGKRPEWFKHDPSSSPAPASAPASEAPADHRGNAPSVT